MSKLSRFLKKIDGKKVSLDQAFKTMEKLYKIYSKDKKAPKQLELDLKYK